MSFNKFSDTKIYSNLEVMDHPTITTKKASFLCNGVANFKSTVILENNLILRTVSEIDDVVIETIITPTEISKLNTDLTTKTYTDTQLNLKADTTLLTSYLTITDADTIYQLISNMSEYITNTSLNSSLSSYQLISNMSDYVTTESLNSSLNSPLTAYQLVADMINYYTKEGSDTRYISIFELIPIKNSIINVANDANNVFVNLRDNFNTKIINDEKYLDISYLSNITNNTNNITTNGNNIITINTTLNNMSVNLKVDLISSSNTTTGFITFNDEVKMTDTVIFEKAIVYDYTTISASSFTINASSRKALYIVNHTSNTTITLNSLGATLDGMILKFRKTTTSNSITFSKGNTTNNILDLTNNGQNSMTFGSSNYIEVLYYFPSDRYILLQSN